jgi:hypothetical protein
LLACRALAVVPLPERLLPDDTLLVVTAPDFGKVRELLKTQPQFQWWDDPAVKPFREHLAAKWKDEFVQPLERELGVKLDDYTSLPQGQVTFALTQNGWQGQDDREPGVLLLLDAKEKSDQLKKNLAELRKKWIDGGRKLKTEKVRDIEFVVLPLSSNDVPKTLQKFFAPSSDSHDAGDESEKKKTASKDELVIGQVDSLLILGNSVKAVEKVVSRMTGGAVPCLGESSAYQANQTAMFRDAPLYGWVNLKALIDIVVHEMDKKEGPDATPMDVKPDKLMAALGVSGLKTLAFSSQFSSEGSLFQFYLGVPESARQGLFKILAGEPKDSKPPQFVPGNVTKYLRWRIDGQKAWATLEKMVNNLSPQYGAYLNLMLDGADSRAKEKDSGFDIRKNLIGNLGDDMISYSKAPRGTTAAQLASPPSLFLLGSQKPEVLTAALKGMVALGQQGEDIAEREFLGRKIYSVALPGLPFAQPNVGKPGAPSKLHFASSSAYVAFSTDVSMIEEYLRSSDSQGKPLRETAGLMEAAQKVTGPGTSLFGYENQAETMRTTLEAARKSAPSTNSTGAASLLPGAVADSQKAIQSWMDFSLFPSFDKVAKYFSFTVYAGSATTDGLTFKLFSPTPAGLKAAAK